MSAAVTGRRDNSMENILIGIDVGTSACKAAAFDLNGNVLAQAAASYTVEYPHPGWAQQDPEVWWKAVCAAIRHVLEAGSIPAEAVAGVGIDGQSWSAIPIDKDGNVLCPTPIWMDTRAEALCRKVEAQVGADRLFACSGNPLSPSYTLPKVLWYREEMPQVYEKTDKILQSNGYIAYKLTGAITQDKSQGYGWACYNVAKNQWDLDLCKELGLRPSLLPEIVSCSQTVGGVTQEAARLTGLAPGTPVAAGGLDAACGTLGAGVIHPGETQEQGGQAGGMSICVDQAKADPRLILSAHVVEGLWLLQGGTVGGGGALNWFEREFGAAERQLAKEHSTGSFQELDKAAAQVAPGSEGLVFLPYMAGERSPLWDAAAKGVYYGIDFSKTRAHFARACMEGVAYSLRHNLEVAQEAGASVGTLRSMGGAANSRVWTQLKADVTGKTIQVPASDAATSLGAAILAGVGVGAYSSFDDAVTRTVRVTREHVPNHANEEAYDEGYRLYRQLYEDLKDTMHKEANVK